jgi:hypothetical protein
MQQVCSRILHGGDLISGLGVESLVVGKLAKPPSETQHHLSESYLHLSRSHPEELFMLPYIYSSLLIETVGKWDSYVLSIPNRERSAFHELAVPKLYATLVPL